ncbi:PREDICTED: DNA-directed RNA polymerases I, II, and III subunit RPABC3-like [Amphimedon queenslandica]|uniref:DNA-directed RNA polymerases I, II, and III subunit RPABC3 n=1 Tax=Amphimedon queenslandica TaxID=400682 RepID=A0AAN0JJ07_AMPQE|nr:PREDICTED: DNA-directed RNA polymerases I, II, and III subunit RPABC3-like [Amphimedon queenslandica]|eukprot:XP_019857010.1 PREDICTED: DNA-directed RNA polymerases I, II, and III subunit RPABC3-like [Amphimedon queenslandica]
MSGRRTSLEEPSSSEEDAELTLYHDNKGSLEDNCRISFPVRGLTKSSGPVFESFFQIKDIEKKFERVSRLFCEGENFNKIQLILDVNTQLYPMSVGDNIHFLLTTTLGADHEDFPTVTDGATSSLADAFQYIMYGKIYRLEGAEDSLSVYVSFGGLLMRLKGDDLQGLMMMMDMNVYLLLKKMTY